MSRGFIDQKSTLLYNVVATAATDGTFYKYIDFRNGSTLGQQLTIAGAGTVTLTVEATMGDYLNEADAASKATWVDVSTTVLGAATKTANYIGYLEVGYTFVRYKIVVASSTATTAYSLWVNITRY